MGNLVPGPGYAALYNTADYVEALQDAGVAHIVNLDGVWGNELDAMIRKTEGFENYITTFVWIELDDPDFKQWVRNHLMEAYEGLRNGRSFTDEIRTDYATDVASEAGSNSSGTVHAKKHIAEQLAFKPADRHNERFEELNCHPDWQFGKPGQLCFEELMDMQDRMVGRTMQTTFIIAQAAMRKI